MCMAAWLGWAARERRRRRRSRREEHCPLLQTCCRCVWGIAHCPIKVPPAHTHTHSKMHTEGTHAHAHTHTTTHSCRASARLCFFSRRPWLCLLRPLSFYFFFFSILSLSCISQVHALLLVSLWNIKERGEVRGGQVEKREGGGREEPCVRTGEKLPCTMWSDLYTDRGTELTHQSRVNNTNSQQKEPTMPLYHYTIEPVSG